MGARLNLHPVGLNDEGRRILSVAMNVLEVSGCSVCCCDQLSHDTVALIDVDSEEGRDFYERSGNLHIRVVIAGDNCSYRADGMIRKPLRVQALRNLLSDISERIHPQDFHETQLVTSLSAEQVSNDDSVLPNVSLFYALVNAVSTGGLYKIVCGDNPDPLMVHGPTRHLYTNQGKQALYNAAQVQGEQLKVIQLDEFEFMKQAQGFASHRIEKVLWIACESGSLGYAPVDFDMQSEFRLNDWPRFDVKHVRPEYLTLTAIATRRNHTFASLARMAGIPLTTVFDFYHAATVCGVVEHVQPMAVTVFEQAPVIPSLVSRIAKKLGLKFF